MKRLCFIFVIICFVCICPIVRAVSSTYENVCGNEKDSVNKSNCSSSSFADVPKTSIERNPVPKKNTVHPSYDVLILIDNSDSMKSKGYLVKDSNGNEYASRKAFVIDVVNRFLGQLKKYDTTINKNTKKSNVNYILTGDFENSRTVKNIYNNGNVIGLNNDSYQLKGNTYLQNFWAYAYQYYNGLGYGENGTECNGKKGDTRAPLVIMITDGFPNSYSSNTDVTTNISPSVQYSVKWTEFSALYAYTTMRTMLSFLQHTCNSYIYNFAIGMNSNDAIVNYMLNPSSDNYKNLDNTTNNPSTVSKAFKEIIDAGDAGRNSVSFYDATANVGGGCGEYGQFYGSINGKTVTFDTRFTGDAANVWSGNGWSDKKYKGGTFQKRLYLTFPVSCSDASKLKKSDIDSIKVNETTVNRSNYYVCNGSKGIECSPDKDGTICHFGISVKANGISNITDINTITVKFKNSMNLNFVQTSVSNPISRTGINGIIKDKDDNDRIHSYVGGNIDELVNHITNFGETSVTYEEEGDPVTTVTHTSCVNNSGVTMNGYVKVDGEVYDLNGKKIGNCAPVAVKVETMSTENYSLNPSKLIGLNAAQNRTYAGGSFKWSIGLKSEIKWYYMHKVDKNTPLVTINPKYSVLKNGKQKKPGDYYALIDDVYSNDSCSTKYTTEQVEKAVWGDIKKNVDNKANNYDFSKHITSVHYNDDTKTTNVPLKTGLDSTTNTIVHNADTSNESYERSIKGDLKDAYIHLKTGEIDYNNHDGDAEYKNTGGRYYVAVKYESSNNKLFVNLNSADYSLLGTGNNISDKCSIEVSNLLFSGGQFKVRYRPINVAKPFPKAESKSAIARSAQNWANWYCENSDACKESNSNKTRLNETYKNNRPLYSIVINGETAKKIDNFNNNYSFYASFDSLNSDGTSKLFQRGYLNINPSIGKSFCGLGNYSSDCDKY